MTIKDYIYRFSNENILNISVSSFPTGHNGIHNDLHTPARLLSHAILILSKGYSLSDDKTYLDKLRELADFLLTFRKGYAFHHILTKEKDPSNGLIGQAWTIEALAEASNVLNDDKYRNIAIDLYFQHKFDVNDGLWYILDISGRHYPKDATFNHQLWFAACASCLKDSRIDRDVFVFLENLNKNLTLFDNGLIHHSVIHLHKNLRHRLGGVIKHVLNGSFFYRFIKKPKSDPKEFYDMCVGYHAFNTYAFSMLKHHYPDLDLWNSDIFNRMLGYLNSVEFHDLIYSSKYGFPYNPPGFEHLYTHQNFNSVPLSDSQALIQSQFDLHFDVGSFYFLKNNPDPDTLSYRLYELCRVDNEVLEKIIIEL